MTNLWESNEPNRNKEDARIVIIFQRCQLQTEHLSQKFFVNKNLPNNPRVGCFKPSDLVGACKVESNLIKELEEKFEGVD